MLMNKCSKHRGLFKPPLTPERFWDADILEEDPDDPRVKTQPSKPLRTRAVRRAEAKAKKKALKMDAHPDDPRDGPSCFKCGTICRDASHLKNHVLSHYYRLTTLILFSPEHFSCVMIV